MTTTTRVCSGALKNQSLSECRQWRWRRRRRCSLRIVFVDQSRLFPSFSISSSSSFSSSQLPMKKQSPKKQSQDSARRAKVKKGKEGRKEGRGSGGVCNPFCIGERGSATRTKHNRPRMWLQSRKCSATRSVTRGSRQRQLKRRCHSPVDRVQVEKTAMAVAGSHNKADGDAWKISLGSKPPPSPPSSSLQEQKQ